MGQLLVIVHFYHVLDHHEICGSVIEEMPYNHSDRLQNLVTFLFCSNYLHSFVLVMNFLPLHIPLCIVEFLLRLRLEVEDGIHCLTIAQIYR